MNQKPLVALTASLALAVAACAKEAPQKPEPAKVSAQIPTQEAASSPLAPRAPNVPVAPKEVAKVEAPPEKTATPKAPQAQKNLEILKNEDFQRVFFAFDQANIRPQFKKVLAKDAALLRANPETHVLIEGFADERGSEAYNLALGERRAEAMAKALEKLGVSPSQLSEKSFGKANPADPGHNTKAWSRNRRAKVVVETG